MSSIKYCEIWNVLNRYRDKFKIDRSLGITCTICGYIMIDPYNALCGCQYCFQCIESYINEQKRHCPGQGAECVQSVLIMGENLSKDLRTSLNIVNIIVKCPHEVCYVETKLMDMHEHIRVCPEKPISCPYESIGCTNDGSGCNRAMASQSEHKNRHCRLLIEAIDHLRNDVNLLKETGQKREQELHDLKETTGKYENEIGNLIKEKGLKEILILEMKEELKDAKNDIMRLRQNYLNLTNEKRIDSKEWKAKFEASLTHSNNMTNQCSADLAKLNSKIANLIPLVLEDFFWKIDYFFEKQGQYYSEPFYKDEYKLRIGFKHGELFLTLYLHVLPGENDDDADWPMKFSIRMGVINQKVLKVYEYWQCQFNKDKDDKLQFERQTCDASKGIYVGSISIDDIKLLTFNDSILICCTLIPDGSIRHRNLTE